MQSTSLSEWLKSLGYADTGDALVTAPDQIGRRPYAAELNDMLDPSGEYCLDAVFLVEDTPTVCFIDAKSLNSGVQVDAIRQRLWNQNLASALLVVDHAEVRAYAIPKLNGGESINVVALSEARADGHWSASEVQSSEVQLRLADWFDPNRRVDRHLLKQLSSAVTSLTSGHRPLVASQIAAQMLLAQVLFISYLEHRGIVGDDYRTDHHLRSLAELVSVSDGVGIDFLIAQLKEDFNGDFLEPSEIRWADLGAPVLVIIERLLKRVDLGTGQADFWNYDFSQIPVELLSGIYETFLQDERKIDGAYYTPRVLAELATEQAFDGLTDFSNLRIYDGACGSGILLTAAFRKIVAYRQAQLGRFLDIHERITLLRGAIFGGDLNPVACRVTAFSLYLCLLERLLPSDLSQLQKDEDCKLPKLIDANIFQGNEEGDFFSPSNPLANTGSFDIVISNPPWRELKAGEGGFAVAWAAENRIRLPHRQIAAAYAAKTTKAAKAGGRIVLILPTSLITAPSNADFLRQLAVRVKLDRLINLSDFRRLLFAQAEHACTVVRLENLPSLHSGKLTGHFEYWTPKVDISFAFNRLTLHEYDRLSLPLSSLVQGNGELRRRFWGGRRDESLFQRLSELSSLGSAIEAQGWVIAKGYHMRDGDKSVDPAPLQSYKFLPTAALNTTVPVVNVSSLQQFPVERGIASYGEMALYDGERVLWPDGTSVQMEIRAAYTNSSFCVPSGVGGIRFGEASRATARLVACYLRSSLAKYWLILTGYTAQTERARVTLNDIKSLPFIVPDNHPKAGLAFESLKTADQILGVFDNPEDAVFSEGQFEFQRDDIDRMIFDYFGLSKNERIVVADMVNLVGESLQPTSYGELLTPIQYSPSRPIIRTYLAQLEQSLLEWSHNRKGSGYIRAGLIDRAGSQTPLDVVHIAIGETLKSVEGPSPHGGSARELLKAIADRISDGRAIDFFTLPNSIFVWGNDIYLIKPSRMRFWSQSAALRDADEVFSMITQFSGGTATKAVDRSAAGTAKKAVDS